MDMGTNQATKTDHALELMSSLEKLKEKETICNFTIRVDSNSYPVHRAVLAACSDYFQAMFTSNMKEVQEGIVEMKDVDADAVKQSIDFMYTGEATVAVENAQQLLHVSNLMQLNRLTTLRFKTLVCDLTTENCLLIKALAQTYNCEEVMEAAELFAAQNFEAVISSEDYSFLSKSDILHCIRAWNIHNELMWKAVMTWIKHDRKNRTEHLVEFMKSLKLESFPFRFLLTTVWKEPLVTHSLPCKSMVVDALFSNLEALKQNLDLSNCFLFKEMIEISQHPNSNEVNEAVIKLMAANFKQVTLSQKFKDLEVNDIVSLLEDSDENVSENEKWDAVITGIRHDTRETMEHLIKFMKSFNLASFHFRFLLNTLWKEPLIRDSQLCKSMVVDALFSNLKALKQNLDLNNCFLLKNMIKNYKHSNTNKVNEAVIKFMMGNFEQVSQSHKFKDLEVDDILSLLEGSDANVWSEKIKWDAALKWVKHDPDRKELLFDMIQCLDFTKFSVNFIEEIVLVEPLVRQDLLLKLLFQRAKRKYSEKDFTYIAVLDQTRNEIQGLNLHRKKLGFVATFENLETMRIVSLDGELFMLSNNELLHLERDGSWETKASLSSNPDSLCCKLVDFQGSIYVIESISMSCYNPKQDSWTENLPGCQFGDGFCVAASDDFIFAVGGKCSGTEARKYDQRAEMWSNIASLKDDRFVSAAAALHGMVYVMGGYDTNIKADHALNTVECYDPNTNIWFSVQPMGCKRADFSACVIQDKIYAVGSAYENNGRNRADEDSVEVYTNEADQWEIVSTMKTSIHSIFACTISQPSQ